MDEIKPEHLEENFLTLNSFVDTKDWEYSVTEEDLLTGLQLLHVVVSCPVKDVKLFFFVDNLLSNETSRTIIQTLVNFFHSGVVKDQKRLRMAKDFYIELAAVLDMQYGNVLLATSTKAQLQNVIDNNWPFFTNNTDLVKACLINSTCASIQNILAKLGKYFQSRDSA